jgi:hypothetical protein
MAKTQHISWLNKQVVTDKNELNTTVCYCDLVNKEVGLLNNTCAEWTPL